MRTDLPTPPTLAPGHTVAEWAGSRVGLYLLRLVPKGWAVPASLHRDGEHYTATVDGAPLLGLWTPDDLWDFVGGFAILAESPPIARLLMFGKATDQATYDQRLALKAWAAKWQPSHPCLTPTKPIDARLLPATDF